MAQPAGGNDVAFSRAGNDVALAHATSPRISVYAWNAGFGTKYSNPSPLPGSTSFGVDWLSGDKALAVAHDFSPRITVYAWSSSGFGAKFADPATVPPLTGNGVQFSVPRALRNMVVNNLRFRRMEGLVR